MSKSFGPYFGQVWLFVDLENWKLYHKCWSRDLMSRKSSSLTRKVKCILFYHPAIFSYKNFCRTENINRQLEIWEMSLTLLPKFSLLKTKYRLENENKNKQTKKNLIRTDSDQPQFIIPSPCISDSSIEVKINLNFYFQTSVVPQKVL